MNDIKEKIKKVIADCVVDIEVDCIIDSTSLVDDLGFSSINLVQLVVDLENEFNIEISDENLTIEKLATFKDVVSIIDEEISK